MAIGGRQHRRFIFDTFSYSHSCSGRLSPGSWPWLSISLLFHRGHAFFSTPQASCRLMSKPAWIACHTLWTPPSITRPQAYVCRVLMYFWFLFSVFWSSVICLLSSLIVALPSIITRHRTCPRRSIGGLLCFILHLSCAFFFLFLLLLAFAFIGHAGRKTHCYHHLCIYQFQSSPSLLPLSYVLKRGASHTCLEPCYGQVCSSSYATITHNI